MLALAFVPVIARLFRRTIRSRYPVQVLWFALPNGGWRRVSAPWAILGGAAADPSALTQPGLVIPSLEECMRRAPRRDEDRPSGGWGAPIDTWDFYPARRIGYPGLEVRGEVAPC